MKASSRLVCLAVFVLACSPVLCGEHDQPRYTFIPLMFRPNWGCYTSAYGINNAGEIVGNFLTVDGNLDGFLFRKGGFTDVVVPGVTSDDRGALNDVNDEGEAVGGFADGETGVVHSFVRRKGGEITVLQDATPGALLTEATGINDRRTIVGFYLDADGNFHGFILREGIYTTYDYPVPSGRF